MIFQEPNAALNPTMTIGRQVVESYLLHQQDDLVGDVVQTTNSSLVRSFYRYVRKNPKSLLIKVMNRIPIVRQWQRPLHKAAVNRAVKLLAQLGIAHPEEVVKRYPHNLSGGMKQRIVIAMALACDPVLLIADEATSNLDVTIQAQILELLRKLKKERISSILLITHDLGVVAETCDRVGVMYAGNLCEEAAVDDLFGNPKHPYTKALLSAVPKISRQETLQSIEGAVPNLVSPPAGCRFHPRCPYAMEVCRTEFPEIIEVEPGHRVACYLYSKKEP